MLNFFYTPQQEILGLPMFLAKLCIRGPHVHSLTEVAQRGFLKTLEVLTHEPNKQESTDGCNNDFD